MNMENVKKDKAVEVAVVGSLTGFARVFVEETLDELLNFDAKFPGWNRDDITILTGNGRGVDSYVRQFVQKNNLRFRVTHNNYFRCNRDIVNQADFVVVFQNGVNERTDYIINYAKETNTVVIVVNKPNLDPKAIQSTLHHPLGKVCGDMQTYRRELPFLLEAIEATKEEMAVAKQEVKNNAL